MEGGILYSIAYAPAFDEIEVGFRCVFLQSACHRRMLAKSEELEARRLGLVKRTDSLNSSPSLSTRSVERKRHSLSDKTKRLATG